MSLRPTLLLLGAAFAASSASAAAQDAPKTELPDPTQETRPEQVIGFAADTMTYDENSQVVTATGNVAINREGYRLRADEVEYDRRTGRVEARGNVIIVDPGGNQAFGDRVELSESLRDGAADNILLVLQDGGRLAAESGTRVNGRSTLNRAVYSPCNIEDENGCQHAPLWQIKAVRIVHDPDKHRIYYHGARLELFGVPAFYLPNFSHPDGSGGNASGLLVPNLRLDRSLGLVVETPYYLPFSSERDLTITPFLYTKANPALGLEYRQLTDAGPFRIGGIATYTSEADKLTPNGPLPSDDKEIRGYIFANGRFQHSPAWRSTFGVRVTTDDTFLRRYDVSRDDSLRNFYWLEHFGSNSYLSVESWAFQGLRRNDDQGLSPIVLPAVDFIWQPRLEPLGGGLTVRVNSLGITRTDGQDVRRALASARWDAVRYTPLGQRVTATALIRGDIYNVNDAELAELPAYAGRNGWEGRILPAAALDVEWPFAGPAFGGIQMLTPRVQLVASGKGHNGDIPNEDARAIDLEDLNLFSLNRFPGFDRWEGGTRLTYGVRWTLDRPHWRIETEVGQSYRFDDKSDIVPVGTGLSGNFSDIVGRTTVRWGSWLDVTHRFRLDKESFGLHRNEIDATFGSTRTYATIGYVRLNRDIRLEDLQDREEIRVGGRIAFARYWSIFGSAIIDLSSRAEDPLSMADGFEPVRHRIGIAYEDECFELGVTWRRDYTQDRDFRRGNTFLVRFALKNLGR